MKILLSAMTCILTCQICEFAAMRKEDEMRMDEIIMAAAKSHKMFDLIHVMNDDLMVMVELDILMSLPELAQYKLTRTQSRSKRKATSNDKGLWLNCIVYYDLVPGDFSPRDEAVIQQAIAEWQNYTCLTFKRNGSAEDQIVFRNGGGCYSRFGRKGGKQPISLAPKCRTKGVVVHEIGHAIGWIHEQARPDRDDFVTINYDQIPSKYISQFAKVRESLINDRDVTYDYDSIMHYSGKIFGRRAISTHDPVAQDRIGQRIGLSFRDIKLANLMYNCARQMGCPNDPCPGEGFRTKNCSCVCPGPLGSPLDKCGDETVTTTPTPSAATTEFPTPPDRECTDLRDDCERLKTEGSCTNDIARMSIFCRGTCDLCSAETACMDYDEACPFFAANGYCDRESVGQFFQEECPLSCEVCEAVDQCQTSFYDISSSSRNDVSVSLITLVMLSAVFCM